MSFASVAIAFLTLSTQTPSEFPTRALSLPQVLNAAGKTVKVDVAKHKATVLLFIATDCPIANRYAPEIKRIDRDYVSKGVRFYRVYLRGTSLEIAKHRKDYGFAMTEILDADMKLAKAIGIRVTPEVAVIGPDGKLLYRGRIDDQNIEHGKLRESFRRDLRVALDEILAGKPVTKRETVAIGCFVG